MQRNTIVFASITLTAMLLASTYGFSHFKSVLAAGTQASTDQVIYLNQDGRRPIGTRITGYRREAS
jgi:hypothetical protein